MNSRKFGVEIEFNSHGRGIQRTRELLNSIGMSHWADAIGYDGSDLEVRSPILSGYNGLQQLKYVLRTLQQSGGTTGTYDGLHIHHDAPEFVDNYDNTVRLVKSWVNNQDIIDGFVASRRRNNAACPKWNDQHVMRLENNKESFMYNYDYMGPRGALNIMSLREHGTIELRQHEGTLDYNAAEAWIRFGQRFIDSVVKRKRPISKVNNQEVLLNRIRISKNAKIFLIRKSNGSSLVRDLV
jgi:hypothetical protein